MRSLILAALVTIAAPAAAQPTFAIWVDQGGVLANDHDVINPRFEVVVTLDSDGHESSAAEWVMTDLLVVSPGVFLLRQWSNLGLPCGIMGEDCLDNHNYGEYSFPFTACVPTGERVELLRIDYGAFGGPMGNDIVLMLRGFEPGDSRPSHFGGAPGIVDCADQLISGAMGGSPGGTTSSGVTWPEGALILNPTRPIPVSDPTFGVLKTRY